LTFRRTFTVPLMTLPPTVRGELRWRTILLAHATDLAGVWRFPAA